MEETKGQDVVLSVLEVFVNRWRHVQANITSFCPEREERKKWGWKAISNGTKDTHIDRDDRFHLTGKLQWDNKHCPMTDYKTLVVSESCFLRQTNNPVDNYAQPHAACIFVFQLSAACVLSLSHVFLPVHSSICVCITALLLL